MLAGVLLGPRCLLVLLCTSPGPRASLQGPGDRSPLVACREAAARLEKELAALARSETASLSQLAHLRQSCRRRERDADTHAATGSEALWPRDWAAAAPLRRRLRSRVEALLGGWHRQLARVTGPGTRVGDEAKAKLAHACLRIVGACVEIGEARELRRTLAECLPALATALGWTREASARRAFLALIADRLAATPGTSDLDLLCEVVSWEELFLDDQRTRAEGRELLTTDLVLVFTERGADGFARSGSPHFRPGRCGDRGFRDAFRDGSDQVRHVCWALRIFAKAAKPEDAAQILRAKELRDALSRKEPLNRSDLALNRAARKLYDALRGAQGGAQDRASPRWSLLFRKILG